MTIEPLEPRIAPATLLNPRTVQYTDSDGDTVTVTISKGAFVFPYQFVMTPSGIGEYLDTLKFYGQKEFNKANLTITAEPSELGGDGKVNIGLIAASKPRRFWSIDGIQLGEVVVDGDLAAIHVGTSGHKLALRLLDVGSMGTQVGLAEDHVRSNIFGNVGKIHIRGNLEDASIAVYRDQFSPAPIQGSIAVLEVDGSLIGGNRPASAWISFDTRLGKAVIKGDVIGGAGRLSGTISRLLPFAEDSDDYTVDADAVIESLEIRGSVIGGSGEFSGVVGAAFIDHLLVKGNVIGGSAKNSGWIGAAVLGRDIQIEGSLLGGSANGTGCVYSNGTIKHLKIGGDLVGGLSEGMTLIESGLLKARVFQNIEIGGSLFAGAQSGSESFGVGAIRAEYRIASLTIGGEVLGYGDHPVIISAGQSIGRILVKQNFTASEILVGYGASVSTGLFTFWNTRYLQGTNWLDGETFSWLTPFKTLDYRGVVFSGVKQMKSLTVVGDFAASSVAVGVLSGADGVFGTADDSLMSGTGSIAKIVIRGQAKGDALIDTRHFGIVAGTIAALNVEGTASPLTNGRDYFALSDTPASLPGDGLDFHFTELRN